MIQEKNLVVDLEDEVIRRSIVLKEGELLWPAPVAAPPPPAPVATPSPADLPKEEQVTALTPFRERSKEVALLSTGIAGALAMGKASSVAFMGLFGTFGFASLIGYRLVWNVVPALHSPLMSVTNAVSGVVGIAGMFLLGGGVLPQTGPQLLAAISVFLANVNIFGVG